MLLDLKAYAIIGAASAVMISGAHITGRWIGYANAEVKCAEERAQVAAEAIEEKNRDDAAQRESASQDAVELEGENARLRRILSQRNNADVSDGRSCILQSDVEQLRDDYYSIFEDRLLAGGGADGPEGTP